MDGALCEDCAKTEGVKLAYDGFWVYTSVKRMVLWYTYLFPLLLIGNIVLVVFHRNDLGNLIGLLTPMGLWVFNVFWLWPKMKIPRWGKWEKMEEARDNLFIAKISGKRKEGA